MKPLKSLIDLKEKVAIVTGGAKGIGYGISYRLAEAGASVIIADSDKEATDKTVSELSENRFQAIGKILDISDEMAVENLVNECVKDYGHIDVLVNNAGIYPNQPISIMDKEQFERIIDVNLRSVFLTTKYVAEEMKKSGGGKIINITSIDALHPSMVGLAAYDASKHGVWGFTKNSALELAESNIWVNAVAPGGILTPGVTALQSENTQSEGADHKEMVEAFLAKIPMHRMGEPDEIGKVVLFLASDLSSYMTGTQIVVDGGALLS